MLKPMEAGGLAEGSGDVDGAKGLVSGVQREGGVRVTVDMDALTGLRGVVALHIVVFHSVLFSVGWDWQGSAEMPWFFLLSGFCLAVVYGALPVRGGCGCVTCWAESGGDGGRVEVEGGEKEISCWKFLWNRGARVMPTTWLTHALAAPLSWFGYGDVSPLFRTTAVIFSIVPLSTATIILPVFNGPAWTVSALVICWCFFPSFLGPYQRASTDTLHNLAGLSHNVHLVVCTVVFVTLVFILPVEAFYTATMNGFFNLPLFAMGMAGGLLRLRQARGEDVGWKCFPLAVFCCGNCERTPIRSWRLSTDVFGALVFGVIVVMAIAQSVTDHGLLGGLWLQLILPYPMLTVIFGLTMDDQSHLATFFRSTIPQWLGDISMDLYLVHYMIIYYITLAAKGPVQYAPNYTQRCLVDGRKKGNQEWCAKEAELVEQQQRMPAWGIPIVIICAILLAWGCNRFISNPIRNRCRAKGVVSGN